MPDPAAPSALLDLGEQMIDQAVEADKAVHRWWLYRDEPHPRRALTAAIGTVDEMIRRLQIARANLAAELLTAKENTDA